MLNITIGYLPRYSKSGRTTYGKTTETTLDLLSEGAWYRLRAALSTTSDAGFDKLLAAIDAHDGPRGQWDAIRMMRREIYARARATTRAKFPAKAVFDREPTNGS